MPSPGELTLAHHGVLFLDELGEFPSHLLDGMRQPLEEGVVHVARRGAAVDFPCDCQVVAATNPCPCGFADDHRLPCSCTPGGIARYRRRFSGPFLDRFDLHVALYRPSGDELLGEPGEASHQVLQRVKSARRRQAIRGILNRRLDRDRLDALVWAPAALTLLRSAVVSSQLTGRGFDRVRRVAVTVADLAAHDRIDKEHVAEALSYRQAWKPTG